MLENISSRITKVFLIRWIVILVISLSIVNHISYKFEEELGSFSAKLANVIMGNGWNIRSFDEHGIPTSHFARLKTRTISPFYVVHYGIIYEESGKRPSGYNYLWEHDKSLKWWNVNPPQELVTYNNFIHAADWVVNNVQYTDKGKAHLLYNFDWPYPKLKGGLLKAPWYSGLTDAYALSLLCKAYVHTGEEKYKNTAQQLYSSTLTKVEDGGSLLELADGNIWIEEYVTPDVADAPKVLNGMVYATFGIYDYERTFRVTNPVHQQLFKAIKAKVADFDLGWWTTYDEVGTLANIKYHKIHIALMDDLYSVTGDKYYIDVRDKWARYDMGFLERNFVKNNATVNSYMILAELVIIFVSLIIVLNAIINYFMRLVKNKWQTS